MRENDTLKTVTALLGVAVVGFGTYKYFANRSEQEAIKSKLQGVIIDANNSGKSILPTVKDVVKDLKTNPKNQTYTVGEYKQMADSLYQYIITGNGGGIIKIFGQMKTNQDVKLLNIYFAVRVYKQDDWYGEFKVNTWNLAQFMSSDLVSGTVRGLLTKLFKQKGITYKIW